MNEEELEKLNKEHFGNSWNELDESIGYWVNKFTDERTKRKQLQNNWKELKKWLEENLDYENDIFSVMRVKNVLSKIQEIESGSDERS